MSAPECKPSLLCRIIGHKWWLRTLCEDTLEKGYIYTNKRFDQMQHCRRCGRVNPSYKP